MCICRHLCLITKRAPQSKNTVLRRALLDVGIGLGVPTVYALLHIVVQRFRFNIFEGYGCAPSVYNTPLAYVIGQAPILALALVSTIYCFASLIRFRRITVEDLSTKACLSPYWYFRLLCLAATEIILSVAGGIMRIVLSSRGQVTPWVSWGDKLEVQEFSAEVWRADLAHLLNLEEARWTMIARAVVFFALFAFSNESRGFYRHVYRVFATRMGSKDKTGRPEFGDYNGTRCSLHNSHNLTRTITASSATSVLSTDGRSTIRPNSVTSSSSTTRVEPGHTHASVLDIRLPWKDLPPEPEDVVDVPPSAATSESMYSTETDPETVTSVDATMTPYTAPAVRRPQDLDSGGGI
ncbi:hypothetical protein C0992_006164 [Termitomyces sp. T32_za158]|nr:hypothetical protein C0992_006164 [Termitomyces sp. T32_za158]